MENGKEAVADAAIVETVWIVQKLDWQYNDEWHSLLDDIPLKAFLDRPQAQKYCDLLTAQEHDSLVLDTDITGYFGGLARMTTMSHTKLMRRIGEAGIKSSLNYDDVNSRTWWLRIWETLSPEKRALLWSLFDLVQFYEVVEVELLP